MFQNLTARESQDALKLVLNCLENPEPVVRMAASSALVSLGDSAAVPYLQIAVAQEQDENIRSVLETNLKKLQQKGKD